ncbi:hypothetical protein DMB38_13715 [Streptomyces sp. WAC 06738]|uniref:hypothetical protein n=1 Tax=Streptomyces sp. WAC 06738 TaxID=2203210 RepID=UPI000F70AB4D|nr:hypothetical protein [Streptomyces sp. WAC 06738]AZM46725.1 hypothetical protein DMB38_13715 [Streptomyces sp. WAC 06738]
MTHDGHGSEPRREERAGAVPPASDGAGPPPGGEPWWAQDPSPAAAAAESEDESTQQIRHLGNRPERPQPPGAPSAGGQPWPLPASPGTPGAPGAPAGPGALGGPEAAAATGHPGAAPQPPYGGPPQQPPAGPPPGAADDAAATQLIPPIAPAPQQRPGDDSDATQLIPSLPGPYENPRPGAYDPPAASEPPPQPGAPPAQPPDRPPFAPPAFDEDSPRSRRHAAPVHTQFEGLFRDGPGGPGAPAGDPGATQRLPPVRPGAAPAVGPQPPYGAQQPGAHPAGPPPGPYGNGGPGGPGGPYYDDDDDRRGGIPRWAAIAIGTAACAAVGITAGWLLSSGDGDGDSAGGATPSASADQDPGGEDDGGKDDGGEKPVKDDPAEAQAEELDALLAESNDSRDAVISSVANIRECKALGKAAKDLRDAAGQRRDLVARLSDLSVDKLPSHEDLTRSLTDAWNASASADDHYAAWADAAKRGKGCGGGGNHLSAGNSASGEATAAKEEAAGLWNPIADKYGLTQRQATQL